MQLRKIVSGGQTGVDRGALDAALACDFPCGGWCPPGRVAEDGQIPFKYPLDEIKSGSYRQRTIQNVVDSDATLIIYWESLEGGTEQTVHHCIKRRKPFKLVDASLLTSAQAITIVAKFIEQRPEVTVLNVAGPRESRTKGAAHYTQTLVQGLLKEVGNKDVQQIPSGHV